MTEYVDNLFRRSVLPLVGLLFVLGVGCDRGGASKQDAQYEQLEGTWKVLDVRQGRISYGEQAAELTFRENDGERTYRLQSVASGDTSTVQGAVEMIAANTLRFSSGFSYPLIWTFDFDEPDELSDTVRFILETTRDDRAKELMGVFGLSGTSQRVVLDLEYE